MKISKVCLGGAFYFYCDIKVAIPSQFRMIDDQIKI